MGGISAELRLWPPLPFDSETRADGRSSFPSLTKAAKVPWQQHTPQQKGDDCGQEMLSGGACGLQVAAGSYRVCQGANPAGVDAPWPVECHLGKCPAHPPLAVPAHPGRACGAPGRAPPALRLGRPFSGRVGGNSPELPHKAPTIAGSNTCCGNRATSAANELIKSHTPGCPGFRDGRPTRAGDPCRS